MFGIHYLNRRPSAFIHGAMDAGERDGSVRRFQAESGPPAMLLSTRAGGVGLNLQIASYVFHFDRWWNSAVENQAEARTHLTVYRWARSKNGSKRS